MLTVENIHVSNIKGALRGMRNPMNSWEKADSIFGPDGETLVQFGKGDKALATQLTLAGPPHRKFLRQIFFCADIIAPDYWWKEMDTYKVSTVANSTSTMHKLTSRSLTLDDFSIDEPEGDDALTIDKLNYLIDQYKIFNKTDPARAKKIWRKLIQKLPMSYNYRRTWSGDYETLRNIEFYRKGHKLIEWEQFRVIFPTLPLGELITIENI
jgi:hypothetical protein